MSLFFAILLKVLSFGLLLLECSVTTSVTRAAQCVRDVPSPVFLAENSLIRYIDIDDETSLEVQLFNEAALTSVEYIPLLFVHGYLDSRWSFLSTVQCLDAAILEKHAVIVPSLRGFGDSQIYSINSTFAVPEFVSDLTILLDRLQVARAFWIGHSMGSFVSHYAAAHAKSYVQSGVLIATAMDVYPDLCAWVNAYIGGQPPDRDFIALFQDEFVLQTEISDAYANQVLRESYKVNLDPYQKAWYELCSMDASTYTWLITAQIIIIWGQTDGVFDFAQQTALRESLNNTNEVFIQVDNIGHNTQWFEPNIVAHIICDLDGIDCNGGSAGGDDEDGVVSVYGEFVADLGFYSVFLPTMFAFVATVL